MKLGKSGIILEIDTGELLVVSGNKIHELRIIAHVKACYCRISAVIVFKARQHADINTGKVLVVPDIESLKLGI